VSKKKKVLRIIYEKAILKFDNNLIFKKMQRLFSIKNIYQTLKKIILP